MTLQEFRKNPELVTQMRQILDMPAIKLWLQCCLEASPVNNTVVAENMSDTVSNYTHGAIKGYHLYHNLFISGGTHLTVPKPVDPAAMTLEPEPE